MRAFGCWSLPSSGRSPPRCSPHCAGRWQSTARARRRRSIEGVGSSIVRFAGRLAGVVAVVVGVTALTWLAMRPAWFAGDDRPVPAQLADELQGAFLHADL